MKRLLVLLIAFASVPIAFPLPVSAGGGEVASTECPPDWTLDSMSSVGAALLQLQAHGVPGLDLAPPAAGQLVTNPPLDAVLLKFNQGDGRTDVCRGPQQETSGHDEFQACIFDPDTGGMSCQPMPPEQCFAMPPPWRCQPVHVTDTFVIPIEMVAMTLQSAGPITGGDGGNNLMLGVAVTEHPTLPSIGVVHGTRISTPSGDQYQLDSFFDIFYEIEFRQFIVTAEPRPVGGTMGGTNCVIDADGKPVPGKCEPFRVEARFAPGTTLPPHKDTDQPYQHPVGKNSSVWSRDGTPLGRLVSGCHKPYQTALPEGHRICTLFSGTGSSDDVPGAPQTCLKNDVEIGVVDLSSPPHAISSVLATTSGPLTLSPWAPDSADPDMWVSSASTASVACAAVGVSISATLGPHHLSPTVVQNWMQHH